MWVVFFVTLNLIQNLSVAVDKRSDPSAAVGMTNGRALVIPDLIRNLLKQAKGDAESSSA